MVELGKGADIRVLRPLISSGRVAVSDGGQLSLGGTQRHRIGGPVGDAEASDVAAALILAERDELLRGAVGLELLVQSGSS